MKACVIQPPYSRDTGFSDAYFTYKMQLLDACQEDVDVIVLPEYSDVPCATATLEETLLYHNKYMDSLLEKCVATAKRCNANVFVNALSQEPTGWRNTTYCFDRAGQLVGKYFKKHLPPLELEMGLDCDYTLQPQEPYVLELEGLRYGFLTCYDFYFYEAFAQIAREKVDIIIGCSLQRSDSHDAIETMCRFLAYNTNAYVLRSSVSFDEKATVCGASMIVAPDGKVLANMGGRFGMACAEFDPQRKYLKAAGYGNPDAPHYEYIEQGRMPWQYRNSGASVVLPDRLMPYPRICAYGGLTSVAPAGSMPAFGAAVALEAEEIAFDLWTTAEGVWVSVMDKNPVYDSNGCEVFGAYTLAQLQQDFYAKCGEKLRGLKLPTFEEILRKFAGRVIMNICVRSWDTQTQASAVSQIVDLIRKYDAQSHCYITTRNEAMIRKMAEYAPEIPCCVCCIEGEDPVSAVDRAIALGAYKVQLCKPSLNRESVTKAHEHGILCNAYLSDDPEEVKRFLEWGIDTVMTRDYHRISQAVKR
ncbi:MAG: hypothetical protein E7447_07050 [Ruminococcaceae bacterium]|nr:hypothetical protein [Oscillospiraceae bacterium]